MTTATDHSINCIAFYILLQILICEIHGIAIDNGVVGTPTIKCGTDQISLWVRTERPFEGKTYVKGEYGKPECSRNFVGGTTTGDALSTNPITTNQPDQCPPCPVCRDGGNGFLPGSTYVDNTGGRFRFKARRKKRQTPEELAFGNSNEMAHLTVQMGTCNLRRERSLTPPGVTITMTVVVSFHHHFITKVDKAYQIRCFYMEADKTVTSEIDVSMPPEEDLVSQATMPVCTYTIRRESPSGPEVRFAKVGDQVYHRWMCESEMPDMFGILVHDCYVQDGQGTRVQVTDDRGCSNDPYVLGDITYATTLLAYVEAHVFKFADRAVLDFQCAISICVKTDGGCDNVTPPLCQRVGRRKRGLVVEHVNYSTPLFRDEKNEWMLHAQKMTVVDLDESIKSDELERLEELVKKGRYSSTNFSTASSDDFTSRLTNLYSGTNTFKMCLSVAGFAILVSFCTFVFTLCAAALGTLYLFRKRT